jgi:regulator of cell morphogenesis and NO signaling
MVEITQTVREIVQQHPAAVPVFEALGIDYCCGGNKSLEDACRRSNVSVDSVLSDLAGALAVRPAKDDTQWMNSSLGELADYVVQQHHAYARRELTRLNALSEKVFLRHGNGHPELEHIRDLVNALADELLIHMLKEEHVLFPRLKIMEAAAASGTAHAPSFFGSMINPIRYMMEDHDDAGELLRSLRAQTHDYLPPVGACMSYQALYQGLADLERDLHQHIHLENNILFPRAIEFEKANRG